MFVFPSNCRIRDRLRVELISMEKCWKKQNDQENAVTTTQQHHPTLKVDPKEVMGTSKKEQLSKEKATTWKVKDANNSTKNTLQGNREEEKRQPKTGEFSNTSRNNSLNSQNKCEKGTAIVQAEADEDKGQAGETHHTSVNGDSQIPPPIKVSYNFDVYRPGQQGKIQISPK
ncbi:hypothetical protein RDI58_014279 [Solanum bulbocastanum]|uniref:Uncharacterized protein n=1 Tax=Solanum bulbocastanum TaxID=147425 RepID=A0AAN8YEN4_SOLBU